MLENVIKLFTTETMHLKLVVLYVNYLPDEPYPVLLHLRNIPVLEGDITWHQASHIMDLCLQEDCS